MLRRALWGRGLRYRKNRKDLPGVPDIVFPGSRIVIFVDGDFWHGKNWRERKVRLKQGHNAAYWVRKIERNIERDRERKCELRAAGWKVLRFWESQIRGRVESIARRVEAAVRSTGG
jgi:DNA mismatch endonuclease (patch repair protein)